MWRLFTIKTNESINQLHSCIIYHFSLCCVVLLCSIRIIYSVLKGCKSYAVLVSAQLPQTTSACRVSDCHGNWGLVDYKNYHKKQILCKPLAREVFGELFFAMRHLEKNAEKHLQPQQHRCCQSCYNVTVKRPLYHGSFFTTASRRIEWVCGENELGRWTMAS